MFIVRLPVLIVQFGVELFVMLGHYGKFILVKIQLALYNYRCLSSCPVSSPQLIVYQGSCVTCSTGC